SQPWQHERELAAQAQQQLDEVDKLQTAQQHDQSSLEDCERNQGLFRQQLKTAEDADKQLAKRAKARDKAQDQVTTCQSRQPQVEQKLAQAKTAYETAKTALIQARQQAQRIRLQTEHDALGKSLA